MAEGIRFDYDEELEWAVYREVYEFAVDDQPVPGLLSIPVGATGLAILLEPATAQLAGLAESLAEVGIATLRVDRLALEQGAHGLGDLEPGAMVALLTEQLLAVIERLRRGTATADLRIGLMASETMAAAALQAAAREPIAALVLHNGRLDLADDSFPRTTAAVLLVVDEGNQALLEINQQARLLLRAERQLAMVRPVRTLGATQDAPGVDRLARIWFGRHL